MKNTRIVYLSFTKAQLNNLLLFIDDFDAYDKEEKMEDRFGHIDLNVRHNFQQALIEHFFPKEKRFGYFKIDSKIEMTQVLIKALQCAEFDFEHFVEYLSEEYSLPYSWVVQRKVQNYRMIYEEVYRMVVRYWGAELTAAGLDLPSEQALNIPSEEQA
ncbi:hypothetical protein IGB42_04154 [Andreprevotia sp. IGB-42]|nr:hypothetical protein IGB42_04154 [Andreprevotia sp. IGB-42]